MNKTYCKSFIAFILICVTSLANYGTVYAVDNFEEAEKMAQEIHQRASSDVIFVDDELKALYYQNIQIISLLKEIKGLLQQSLQEEKKEE